MNAIGELFVSLGFDVDDAKIDGFSKTIGKTIDNIGKLTLAAAAVITAMDKIVDSATRGTIALENFNAQTGLSIDKLQGIQIAAQMSNIGLTADDVTSSVMALQSQLAAIRIGQGNIAPFQLMGVDVLGQDAFSVLDQIREKIKGLDDMTATNIISQMGINPQMITYLRMSNKEWAVLNKQIVLTRDEREELMRVGIETKKLHMIFDAFLSKTVAKMEPFLVRAGRSLENIVYAIEKLNLGIPVLLVGMGSIVKLLGLMNLETLGLTAAIAALLLLLDDFAVWSRGGKSLFDYTGLKNTFDGIGAMFHEFAAAVDKLASIKNISELPKGIWGVVENTPPVSLPSFIGEKIGKSMVSSVQQTNNWNIYSNASDAEDVAGAMLPQLEYANQGLNNGGF